MFIVSWNAVLERILNSTISETSLCTSNTVIFMENKRARLSSSVKVTPVNLSASTPVQRQYSLKNAFAASSKPTWLGRFCVLCTARHRKKHKLSSSVIAWYIKKRKNVLWVHHIWWEVHIRTDIKVEFIYTCRGERGHKSRTSLPLLFSTTPE